MLIMRMRSRKSYGVEMAASSPHISISVLHRDGKILAMIDLVLDNLDPSKPGLVVARDRDAGLRTMNRLKDRAWDRGILVVEEAEGVAVVGGQRFTVAGEPSQHGPRPVHRLRRDEGSR